jgi:TatD DNase family protein
MFIDTHAHLDYGDFDADREAVLARALAEGVTEIISIGTRVDSSARAVALAQAYPPVWATVGIHPSEVGDAAADYLERLRELARNPRVVAIGEIGLDYHRLPSRDMQNPLIDALKVEVAQDPMEISQKIADDAYKNKQADFFREQLDLAVELGLNAVIHQRDAWEDCVEILRGYAGKVRGVFHCFGGTVEQAQEVITMGHLVSFTGIVTFKNGKNVQEAARTVAENAFMVETDCPYLAPVPHRGKRCEPWHTRLVGEKIAELRGVRPEEIAAATTRTAREFFKFRR